MTLPSSTAAVNSLKKGILIKFLLPICAIIFLLLVFKIFAPFVTDPFIGLTLNKQGSIERGNSIFRMNCVGCHGIAAQGLVGPDLHDVSYQLSDKRIINQVTKGLTPPMPSFEIDPQSMADLLAYMHSLN